MGVRKGIVTLGLAALLTGTAIAPSLADNISNIFKQEETYVVIQFIAAKDYTKAVKLKKEIESIKIPYTHKGKEIGALPLFLDPKETEEGTLWVLVSAPFDNRSLAEMIGKYLNKDYFVYEYEPVPFPFSPYGVRTKDSKKNLEENLDKLELSILDNENLMILTRKPYSISLNHFIFIDPFQFDENSLYTPIASNMSKIKKYLKDDKFVIYEIGSGSHTCPIYVILSTEKYNPPYPDVGKFVISEIH